MLRGEDVSIRYLGICRETLPTHPIQTTSTLCQGCPLTAVSVFTTRHSRTLKKGHKAPPQCGVGDKKHPPSRKGLQKTTLIVSTA